MEMHTNDMERDNVCSHLILIIQGLICLKGTSGFWLAMLIMKSDNPVKLSFHVFIIGLARY